MATKKAGKSGKTVTIEQIASPNRRPRSQEQTLIGLGLNKIRRRRTLEDTPAVPRVAGEPWLHVAYLFGLCACAVIAAVYRDRTQWTRLAVVGGPVLAATLALGWLQLS